MARTVLLLDCTGTYGTLISNPRETEELESQS